MGKGYVHHMRAVKAPGDFYVTEIVRPCDYHSSLINQTSLQNELLQGSFSRIFESSQNRCF